MKDSDLDDFILGIVEVAEVQGEPLTYAVGPKADRRVRMLFRDNGLWAPADRLCGSINRLVATGRLKRLPTGDFITGSGSCIIRRYDIMQLVAT